jgi:2-polyprenyl-3-methyl-5-hydroxy-6-metoxy-1,4-benzoquinol methylase
MAIRGFSGWDALYREQPVESMPWYFADLDPDVAKALSRRGLSGGHLLDLGTGPGTQAMALAARGFEVVGADVSRSAVEKASHTAAARKVRVDFVQDDILATRLEGPFDVVLDRGCFHVFDPNERARYLGAVAGLLSPGGWLLLKCFSDEQPGTEGPHRFSPDGIRALFGPPLEVLSIERTVYQGTLDPLPRALFCEIRRLPQDR